MIRKLAALLLFATGIFSFAGGCSRAPDRGVTFNPVPEGTPQVTTPGQKAPAPVKSVTD